MRIYLAHPREEWIREEELAFEKKYGIDLINPYHDQPPGGDIVTNDIELIRDSDAVLVVTTTAQMIGAFMEMVYAKMFGKPVYLIDRKGVAENMWIRYHTTIEFEDFDDAGSFLSG